MKIQHFKNMLAVGLIMAGALLCSSCETDFLERAPQDKPQAENFLVDEEAAKQLVVASYEPWIGDSDMYRKRLIILMDAMTDDGHIRLNSSTNLQGVDWQFLPNWTPAEKFWSYPYRSINAANYAIENIPILLERGSTQESLDPLIAEARFMRGFGYLFLVTFFGEVPLVTKPLDSFDEFSQPRASIESIYDQIISDFSFAREHLPENQQTYEGSPTKATSAAFLAKAYLYKEDFEQAETAAREAIEIAHSAGYHLVDDYEAIFDFNNEGNPELLFYFGFVRNHPDYSQLMSVERNVRELPGELYHVQGGEGWGYALPTRDLYDAFEEGDPRRDYSLYAPGDFFGIYNNAEPFTYEHERYNEDCELVTFERTYQAGDSVIYDHQWSPTGLNVKKLTEDLNGLTDVRYGGLDVPIMRMADLYLILAEALAEQGNAEALLWVNEVRARVDLGSKTADDGSLVEIVRHERRVELALEGQRLWDLMRWDVVKEVLGGGNEVPLHFYSDCLEEPSDRFIDASLGLSKYPSDKIYFPIPQHEMDQNSAIINNNPGY